VRLVLEEGYAVEAFVRLPLPEAVEAVDARAAVLAGTVGAESRRGAQHDRFGVAEIEGQRVARPDEQLRQAAHLATLDVAAEESLAGRAAEAGRRLALAVLHGEESFRGEVRRQQPPDT